MLGKTILMMFFGLILGGCASDGRMESSGGSSSTADGGAAVSSPAMSSMAATESTSTSPTMSGTADAESNSTNQPNSSRNRIAAGVEEETLDTCLAHIPQDATAGQKMMAEQTCRRDYALRR